MGLFGTKIACEQCSKKVKESAALYFRGSQFCSPDCINAWKATNPGPVARGEPAKLQEELRILLDEAYTEAHRTFGVTNIPGFTLRVGNNTTVSVGFGSSSTDQFGQQTGALGMAQSIDASYQQEQAQEARMQFQTHVLRSAPLLRALGYAAEADAIDSHDFAKHDRNALLGTLGRVRQAL